MKEMIIEVTIDDLGQLEAETFGFKGKVCEKELKDLLSSEFVLETLDRKDDYYKSEETEFEKMKMVKGRRS